MATIPFDPPSLLTARRSAGFVDVAEEVEKSTSMGWDGVVSNDREDNNEDPAPPVTRASLAGPTFLKRTQTMAGNIVVLEEDGKPSQAFWLQRKIGKTSSGVTRLGYKLRRNTKPEFKESTEAWELATDERGLVPLVKVSMMHSSVLDLASDVAMMNNPLDELSAMQMIAKRNRNAGGGADYHVVSTELVATCSQHVYAILPYHRDGTLLQLCQREGSLDEPVARFIFRQILKGMKTLQEAGLCHRNLSLDAIELDGDHVDICGLGWAMRFNKNAPVDDDRPLPIPGGTNPQYIAPEYYGTSSGIWDGFAADLWACGLMLFSMVVSSEALFVVPIPEDRTFLELCVKGNTARQVKRYCKARKLNISLSDDLHDLLKRMLKRDPKERLSLDEVLEHPWVTCGDVVLPSVWVSKKQESLTEKDKETS